MKLHDNTPKAYPPSPYRSIVSQTMTLATILALTTLAAVVAIAVTASTC